MYDQRDDDGDNDDMVTFFVRALYDYQSADASSLSFRRGALIEVLTQLESGWWDGLLDGERGWFPSNYVVQVSDQEVEQELATRITNHNDDMSQQTHWNEDGLEYNQSDQSVARADDYWMPQVTAGGQIFYMNTRTGQVSSEIPQTVDPLEEYVQPSPSSSQPTQHPPPQSNNNNFVRARSDTRDTYSSTVSGFSEATTAPPSAGFGLITRSDQIPEPWVKRLADDGLSYFYVNKETGAVRWSPPSPIDLKEPQKLPVEALELDDTEWTLNDAADWGLDNASSTHGTVIVTNDTRPSPSLKETIASQTSSKPPERYRTHLSAPSDDVRRASVYSDDSEVNPFGRSSPPLRSPPATRPNGNHPTEPLHSQTPGTGEGSQPIPQVTVRRTKSTTAVAAPPPISAESLARRLQARLLPPPPETVDSLSSIAREAISAVVEAVGQQPADSNDPSAEQPTIMAVRVAAVVTAVRNLLYVSGTLSTPVSSLYLSRHSIDDVIESGRTPLMELKPFQRKVTATLSKLVLSARAAASNPDWPYDDAATRVDNDASELERAVMSFVMEVGRMEVLGSMVNEKRLRGVLISADGSNGVGMGVYGAGFAGMWKGAGFVRPEDGDHGPQWTLGSDMLRELSGLEALAEESLALLLENTSVEKEALIPLVRMALVNLTAYLAAVEDCDIARTIDVDGFQPGDQQGAPELVAEYAEQVELARRLIRSLEASKQAVYDDGSCVWTAAQACYAESITGDGEQLVSLETLRKREETLLALGLDIPSGWPSHMSLIYAAVTSLRESLKDIMKSLESLLDVGIRQEEAASQGVHGSVGHRDGQVGRQRGMAGANNNNNLHHGLHHQGGLGMNLDFGFDDQEEEEDGEDGGEGMVDVGFALGGGGVVGGGKKRSSYLPSRRPPPQSGHPGRPGLPHLATSASVPLLDPIAEGSGNGSMPRSQSHLGHASSLSMGSIGGTEITAGSTLRESLDEGGDRSSKAESKTSTIREGTYANGNKQENGKDEEYHSSDDDDLGIPAPKVAKSPARTTKVEKFFGDDTPAHYIASHNANQAAWYLRNESTDKEILINPDGGVRGGTLPALVERLTLHNYRGGPLTNSFGISITDSALCDRRGLY
ncbi:hypothetical protein FRC03_006202 [Tulasnella sp. 419]|nr:hypothetical protein FRC03_006202 [Tulasnella sp. 419]